MDARNYESLLNLVFGDGKTSRGVDAEMFLAMEDAYLNVLRKEYFDSHVERVMDFKRAFLIIREQVSEAISTSAQMILSVASNSEIKFLEETLEKLNGNFFDREELCKIIRETLHILKSHNFPNTIQQNVFVNKHLAHNSLILRN